MPASPNLAPILSQTLQQLIDAVLIVDAQGRVQLFNPAAEKFWGLPAAQLIGSPVDAVLSHPWLQQLQHGSSHTLPITHSNGQLRWGSLSVCHSDSDDGPLLTVLIKDISEQQSQYASLQQLSMVVDQTDKAILITDAQWRVTYVNNGFSKMLGYTPEQILGRTPISVMAPYSDPKAVDRLHERLHQGSVFQQDRLCYCADGQRIWCDFTINPVFDQQGQLINVVTVLTDITHTKMHEVLQNHMLTAMVSEEPLESLMEIACKEVERIAPEVTASILRVSSDGLLHPLAGPSLPASYCQALEGVPIGPCVGSCGTAAYRGEPVLVSDIASDPLWAEFKALALPIGLRSCWSTPIKDSQGRVLGTFAFYYREPRGPSAFHQRLIEVIVHLCALALEREESRSKIRQLAFYDSLTELPNRSLLHAKADQALAEAERNKTPLSVLFVDLDRFKQVNDSLGHPAGDELLRLVAKRLSEHRRHCDIVGRLSGDEFVLVLPQCDSQQVSEVVEQLKATLSQPCQLNGTTLCPSASIGISLYPLDGHDMGTLVHRADMAMYQAKSAGRGHFSFFSHELNLLAQERLALENALREALEQDQLQLYYQPQVRMPDGLLYGVEALARWHHPQFGEISPARFIPLAEECGLINQLGLWAVREACRQLAQWRRQGLQIPAVSVNLSPTNFHNLDLPGMVASTLREHQLQARDLTLEITENVLMDTNPSTLKTLDEVHAQGVRLSLDDFGTGYSSLSYLRRLPIQELKLDRSFVSDLDQDATNRALSEAVIRLGESLQLTVVAEGIETNSQYQILKQQGYHVAQGYLFSRALAAKDLEAWLHTATLSP